MKVKELSEVLKRANPEWEISVINCRNDITTDTEIITFYNLESAELSYPITNGNLVPDASALSNSVTISITPSNRKPVYLR